MRCNFIYAILFLSCILSKPLSAQCTLTTNGTIGTPGRVFWNGTWHEVIIPVPGTKIDYLSTGDCDSGKTNCNGEDYTWTQLIVFNNFTAEVEIDMEIVQVNVEHVNNHYDNLWTPHGYTRIGTVDFSKNCHGYTFDKNCWVLPGSDSLDIVINDGGPVCYPFCSRSQGKYLLAADRGHSAKMTGQECEYIINEESFYLGQVIEIISKDGPSALYKKTGDCYNAVDTMGPYTGDFEFRNDP